MAIVIKNLQQRRKDKRERVCCPQMRLTVSVSDRTFNTLTLQQIAITYSRKGVTSHSTTCSQTKQKNCKMEQRNQTTIADRYLPLAALCAVATRTHRHAALHGMYRRPWVAVRVGEGHCALILSRGGAGLAAARCSCGAYHRVASWRGPWVVWCYKLIDEKKYMQTDNEEWTTDPMYASLRSNGQKRFPQRVPCFCVLPLVYAGRRAQLFQLAHDGI